MVTTNIPNIVIASTARDFYQPQIDAIIAYGKRQGRTLSILEAGCGRRWEFDLTGVDYKLTGVDLDQAALELRKTKARDLDLAICGDLCSVELPEASFDVVFSSYVLEHIKCADVALENFVKWLKPGGLLILSFPERETVRGFAVRVLPFWSHVWFYRYIRRDKLAGHPGWPPYPTYSHPLIGTKRLFPFLDNLGVKCSGCYGDGYWREGSGLTRILLRGIINLVSMLSMGTLTAVYTNVAYIGIKSASRSGSCADL